MIQGDRVFTDLSTVWRPKSPKSWNLNHAWIHHALSWPHHRTPDYSYLGYVPIRTNLDKKARFWLWGVRTNFNRNFSKPRSMCRTVSDMYRQGWMVKWYLGTCQRLLEFEHWWVSGQIFGILEGLRKTGHESTKSVRTRIAKFGLFRI